MSVLEEESLKDYLKASLMYLLQESQRGTAAGTAGRIPEGVPEVISGKTIEDITEGTSKETT